jgi:hypothetical protein
MKTAREWMQDRRVAAALAALAVLLVVYRLYPGSTGKAPAPSPPPAPGTGPTQGVPAPAQASPGAAAGTPAAPARPAGEIAWSWGRNPFLPPWGEKGAGETAVAAGAGGQASEIPSTLRGTVISGNSGIAIFGSRLVPLGGTVGEWTVERVDPYGVSLRKGKEVRVMELFKPSPSGVKGRGGDR